MKKGVDYPAIYVCGVCHDGNGEVLYARRGPKAHDENGTWNLGAGGTLEHGETIEECLEREMLEEIGTGPITSDFIGIRELFREHNGERTHWVGFYYKVLVDREKVRLVDEEEADAHCWKSFHKHPSPMISQFEDTYEKFKKYF